MSAAPATSLFRPLKCGHCGETANAKLVSPEWRRKGLPDAICGNCFGVWFAARQAQAQKLQGENHGA